MHNQENQKTNKKSWLQRLKDESWEAELLVSAIAIFGTFKLFGIINWLTNLFINMLYPNQYTIGYMIVFFGLIAISILASMFVIHFILRAYWIGLVGLNSVFPDYSIKDSAYSKVYTEKILENLPKLEDSIEKADELCSVIFSAAFTFLSMYMYMAIIATLYILLFNILSTFIPETILLIPALLLFVFVFGQSIFAIYANTKRNKEKVGLQLSLYKLSTIVSSILFGPLYKSISQVTMIFTSNFKKKKRLAYLMLTFITCGFIVAIVQITNTNILYLAHHEKYIDNNLIRGSFYDIYNEENDFLLTPELETDKLTSNTIKVFIPLYKHERKARLAVCNYEKEGLTDAEEDELVHQCYKKYLSVKVNNEIQKVEFSRYMHPRTDQFGVLTYFQANNLKTGKNNIEIQKKTGMNYIIPVFYFPEK